MKSARSLKSCHTEQQSRNPSAGYQPAVTRKRLSHQEIFAAREEIRML
jgi:hypothetical protein